MSNVEILVTDGPGLIVFHGIVPECIADHAPRSGHIQVEEFVMPSMPGKRFVQMWRYVDLPCEVRHG